MNQAHAGEPTLEAHGYYLATGYGDDLGERFRVWFDRYARRRADPGRLNPQVRNDPFVLWWRVQKEMAGLYDLLGARPNTLNSWFLNLGYTYSSWLATGLLVGPNVELWPDGGGFSVRSRPAEPALAGIAAGHLHAQRELAGHLERYAARLAPLAAAVPDCPGRGLEGVEDGLAALAAGLQSMRPFLIRGYRPRRTLMRLTPDTWGAWVYSGAMGGVIGRVVVGATAEDVLRHVAGHTADLAVSVNRQGLLCSHPFPWLKANALTPADGIDPLGINHALLSRVHARLFELFDRVDLDRFRRRARSRPGVEDEEAADVACLDLARRDAADGPETAGPTARLVPALRFSRLTCHLAKWFGCEVEFGKGSEVKVFRPGHRVFTLGRHKADFEVHPSLVRRLLRRLGITPAEWVAAVYGEL